LPRPQAVFSAKKTHRPIVFSTEVVAAVVGELRIGVVQFLALWARLSLCRCRPAIAAEIRMLCNEADALVACDFCLGGPERRNRVNQSQLASQLPGVL